MKNTITAININNPSSAYFPYTMAVVCRLVGVVVVVVCAAF